MSQIQSFDPLTGLSTVRAATPAEEVDFAALAAAAPALQAEAARLAAIDTTIAGDATIAALKAMDNAAFAAWWAANVTTLAQASAVMQRIARVVIRRLL